MDKEPEDKEKHDPIPGYLITMIYAIFSGYLASFYISDRKMVIMLIPVFYFFWYMVLFFTE